MAEFFTIPMIITIALLAVMVACPTLLLYKVAQRYPAAHPVPFFPQGVQGWLLLFVATVVLSIIVTLFNMSTLHTELVKEGAMNYALFMPHVIVLILYFYLLWIITCKRNASVVKQTIVILWVVGPISIALLMAFFNTSFDTNNAIRSTFYALVWTGYFLLSKRVACTYGTKAVDSYVKLAIQMAQAQKEQAQREQKAKSK